jgi:hypothetical protein
MTEQEFKQLQQEGKVETISQETQTPPQQSLGFESADEYISALHLLRAFRNHVTSVPTFIPKSFAEQIQLYDDGTIKKVLFYIKNAWQSFLTTGFDPFDQNYTFWNVPLISAFGNSGATGSGAAEITGGRVRLSTGTTASSSARFAIGESSLGVDQPTYDQAQRFRVHLTSWSTPTGSGGKLYEVISKFKKGPKTLGSSST